MSTIPASSASVLARIARLPTLPLDEIKTLWRELFGSDPTTFNRAFLERRIAYKLQENEYRQVDPESLKRNQARVASVLQEIQGPTGAVALMPGTVLTREHAGVTHRILVRAEGDFEWDGRPYRSLSVIARAITGTRWSGPAFFGLRGGKKERTA